MHRNLTLLEPTTKLGDKVILFSVGGSAALRWAARKHV
jgi:hypothetical protein